MTTILSTENVNSLIGKAILWTAPGYRNQSSAGIAIICACDEAAHNPILARNIVGDNLELAILDGPEFCYSDIGRLVTVREVWDLQNPEEKAAYREALQEFCADWDRTHKVDGCHRVVRDNKVELVAD